MNNDLMLVSGIVLALLSLPSMLNAWAEARPPRVGGIILVTGAVLIASAVMNASTPYRVEELPDVFLRVIARILR